MEDNILKLAKEYGFTGISIIIIMLLLAIIIWYDNFKSILGDIQYYIGKSIGWCKRSSIKNKIESICDKTLKQISKEAPELNLPALSIDWVKENEFVQLKEGEAIVKLKFNHDNTRNIINITTSYVQKAVLPTAIPFIAPTIKKAIDFAVVRKVLLNIPNNRFLISQFIAENVENIESIKEDVNKIELIDDSGLFTRLLLREYSIWGDKLCG